MAKRRTGLTGTNLEIASLTELQEEARRLGVSLTTKDGFQKQRSSLLREIKGKNRAAAAASKAASEAAAAKRARAAAGRAARTAETEAARKAISGRLSGAQEMFERTGVAAGSRTPGAQMTFTDYIQGQQAKVMRGSKSAVVGVSKDLGPLNPRQQAQRRAALDASRTMRTPEPVQKVPPAEARAATRPARLALAERLRERKGRIQAEVARTMGTQGSLSQVYGETTAQRAAQRPQMTFGFEGVSPEERKQAQRAARAESRPRREAYASKLRARKLRIQEDARKTMGSQGALQGGYETAAGERQAARVAERDAARPGRVQTAERLRRRAKMLPRTRLGAILGVSTAALGGGFLASRVVGGKPNEADMEALVQSRAMMAGTDAQMRGLDEQMQMMQAAAAAGEARASLAMLVAGHERKLAQIQQGVQSSVVAQMAALGVV